MTQPLLVHFNGRQYLRAGVTKLAAAVNLAVYDPTHEVEAQKWVADQLRKKRRVWRDLAEQMDFVLFSSDIPDAQKAVFAIRQKFDKMFDTPVKLIELVEAEQLQTKPVAPVTDRPAAPATPPVPATAPGADAARKAAAAPLKWNTHTLRDGKMISAKGTHGDYDIHVLHGQPQAVLSYTAHDGSQNDVAIGKAPAKQLDRLYALAEKHNAAAVTTAATKPLRCPECGSKDIEDNGEPPNSSELTYACNKCHHQWQAHPERNADLHDPPPGGVEDAWDNGSSDKSRFELLRQLKIPPYGDREFTVAEAWALAKKRWRDLPQTLKDNSRFVKALRQDVKNVYGF